MGRIAILAALLLGSTSAEAGPPGPVPDAVREQLKLDPFYQRYVEADGLPVVGSTKVTDHALAEAAWIVSRMLDGRGDILTAMRNAKVRVVVMAATEFTTDVPEHSKLKPQLYCDRRARGLGATPSNPAVSCGEENLLGYPGDPYPGENILIHEFAHAIHGTGLNAVAPTFDGRLKAAYQSALGRGLWKKTYAAANHSEYWAEGVQCWFDDNAPPDALHNDVRTRARLKNYDPGLAKLCAEVFGDGPFRYQRPAARPPEARAHLSGFLAATLPAFRWREAPIGELARATIDTSAGAIEVELDARAAPEATRAFLKIALEGGYHGAGVSLHESQDAELWLRASVPPGWRATRGRLVKREAIPASNVKIMPGTLALVRDGKGAGDFFLCVKGAPPEKDLVPVGRIVRGHEVVQKLLHPPDHTREQPAAPTIQRVIRTE